MDQIALDPAVHDALCDPARLRALEQSGLDSRSDPEMERIATRVQRWLDVPVALVTLVQPAQQVFPGFVGLPEPWASRRATPLSHSFCRHVVATAEPLIVENAPEHPLVRDNLAIPDLGVMAYAGMPLTDAEGHVLGSLCAIDTRPRPWTPGQTEALRDLAWGCSVELRLRLARFDAEQERARRDLLEGDLRRSFDRSQSMLLTSQAFTRTATVTDVRDRISELASARDVVAPSYVGISLLGPDGRLHRYDGHAGLYAPSGATGALDGTSAVYRPDAPVPSAASVRLARIVHHGDRPDFDSAYPAPVRRLLRDLGLHSVVAVPLTGDSGVIGSMVLGWDVPRRFDPVELLPLTTVAGFAAQALHRAELLQHRIGVAQQLQNAMLSPLPSVPGLVMAARYRSADSREHVGGDWYDAAVLPGGPSGGSAVAVSVGDVLGHNLGAATVMGQLRPMLRQACWDHAGEPPSHALAALESATTGMGRGAMGTAVLAYLRAEPTGAWAVSWTNAGHPPPVVLAPGEPPRLLEEHDHLFGVGALASSPRHDHDVRLEPGSLLFLYSDGLVEQRGHEVDEGLARLTALLDRHRDVSCQRLVDIVVERLAADAPDDVVVLALRIP
ncbi:SpoIIE family protein phosphatase [Pseudonocardia sp. KRD-184]|uniref:SpoIIE family protein phosphatase n=1 Tax=Pseudonocardia oceani TaxID=2792013 RepID=A0ABS6U8X9_9PSEU|nr:SpoIIE family protein phosphatase [Pseudonocardia oceani]MBW0089462.1 SpoIIE family protein phosphatase [Pseudonocardia oceani]MBW0096468.1 SpoIIE family protein phosphatase [Pseudonocardia oceani]MBW0109162.1 SpoIIE family protein phosphatase [Pseudonocardia oceani]MBW0120685.1 SpoIIE family protein phosphatase [Pseudonocardia oceani]MBW0128381.1 SpoIIE family protein phosphatase [Pseudonocardia oceani]